MAEGANRSAPVKGTDGVAAILDHPKIMFGGQSHDSFEVKWVTERVRQHDSFGAHGNCGFEFSYINVVSRKLNVDKGRDESVLDNRIDGCWKSSRYGDDFVSGGELA